MKKTLQPWMRCFSENRQCWRRFLANGAVATTAGESRCSEEFSLTENLDSKEMFCLRWSPQTCRRLI